MTQVQLVFPELLQGAVSYPPFCETRSPGLTGHRECQADSDAGVYKTGVDRVSLFDFDYTVADALPVGKRRKRSQPSRGTASYVTRTKTKEN